MVEALRRHPLRIVSIIFAEVLMATVTYLMVRPSVRSAAPSTELYPVRGIDISAHNGRIDFTRVARQVKFVMIKATEGATWNDKNFDYNYRAARDAGLKVGAYHFFRFDRDGTEQARNINVALFNRHLDIPLAIDVEDTGNASGVAHDTIMSRLHALVDFLESHGYSVMFYTNKQGYRRYIKDDFSMYPLWLCSFSNLPADMPWTFWQYSHSGSVDGIEGEVDMNTFNGKEADFTRSADNGVWHMQ